MHLTYRRFQMVLKYGNKIQGTSRLTNGRGNNNNKQEKWVVKNKINAICVDRGFKMSSMTFNGRRGQVIKWKIEVNKYTLLRCQRESKESKSLATTKNWFFTHVQSLS